MSDIAQAIDALQGIRDDLSCSRKTLALAAGLLAELPPGEFGEALAQVEREEATRVWELRAANVLPSSTNIGEAPETIDELEAKLNSLITASRGS